MVPTLASLDYRYFHSLNQLDVLPDELQGVAGDEAEPMQFHNRNLIRIFEWSAEWDRIPMAIKDMGELYLIHDPAQRIPDFILTAPALNWRMRSQWEARNYCREPGPTIFRTERTSAHSRF